MIDRLPEEDLKEVCLRELIRLKRINQDAIVASEFPLTTSRVRADLAILTKTKFTAIEIKSDRDSLRRLPRQMEIFSHHFDRLVLVLAGCHAKRIISPIPPNVEIWRIGRNKISRYKAQADKRAGRVLYELMTLKERKIFLKALCIPQTDANSAKIRTAFENCFRARYAATSAEFWNALAVHEVVDLGMLSRQRKKRVAYAAIQERRNKNLNAWLEYQSPQDSSVS